MALIFHQNMRTFGGGAPGRNAAYTAALTAINAATGPVYLAAGFTEITNPNAPLRGVLAGLAATLDPGLTRHLIVEVGTTALGMREFIGIAWDPLAGLAVQHAGHVLRDPVNKSWRAYDTPLGVGAIPNNTIPLPGGVALGADQRGLAYIAGIRVWDGNPYVLGFMHNMYALGDRTAAFGGLPYMADLARQAAGGGYVGAEVIVGGDFNVDPRNPKRARGAAFTMVFRAARDAFGALIPTTAVNTYDYWVVSNAGIADADASVYANTRVALASDHAGITLDR
jgi:hypothetical protein